MVIDFEYPTYSVMVLSDYENIARVQNFPDITVLESLFSHVQCAFMRSWSWSLSRPLPNSKVEVTTKVRYRAARRAKGSTIEKLSRRNSKACRVEKVPHIAGEKCGTVPI